MVSMRRKVLSSTLSLSLLLSPVAAASKDTAVCNANHIFNAIHSSMRQWGGSLNHNGMSFFLATVPEGTQLYHGTSNADFVQGMQWLAFEPEHALIFARPPGGPRGPPPGEGEGPPGEGSLDQVDRVAKGRPHDREGWEHHGPPQGFERGPPPPSHHHNEFDHVPEHYPPCGKDREHRRPSPDHENRPPHLLPHEGRPCNGSERHPPPPHHEHGPSPPDGEHGPRKGGHRKYGPPPPLPPGHIYRSYPPPPRKDRPYKGPKHPPNPEHYHGPPPEHGEQPPKHHGPPPPGHPNEHNDDRHDHFESIELRSSRQGLKKRLAQQPLLASSPSQEKVGYLHTYAPKHDLRLLYVDGLSAGKTSNGTLDTQDRLLLNLTADDIGGPMGGEMARARGLCDLASTIWEGKIDGILRLEGGFEIILCDFEKHLERLDVVAVTSEGKGKRGPMGGWEYIKAITSRYHGIGGGRVKIDYEHFVTVFAYEKVRGLWDNDVQSDHRMPRLTNVQPSELQNIKNDVTSLILSKDWTAAHKSTNWQAIADTIIARYSSPLHHLTSTPSLRTNKKDLADYLTRLLRPFIDPTSRNATLETSRCVAQLIPTLPSLSIPPASLTPLAHRALHTVTSRICDTLLTSLSIASSPISHSSYSAVYAEHAVEIIEELVSWLQWTSWKECGTCKDEEVCFVPIWPMGSREDHQRPRCRGPEEVEGRSGYWGQRRGPPGGTPSPLREGEGKGGRK